MKNNVVDFVKYKKTRDINKSLHTKKSHIQQDQVSILDLLNDDFKNEALKMLSDMYEYDTTFDKIDNQCSSYKKNINSFDDIANTVTIKRPETEVPASNIDIYLADYIYRDDIGTMLDIDSSIYDETQTIKLGKLIGFDEKNLKILLNEKGKKIYDTDNFKVEYSFIHMEHGDKLYVVNINKIILREMISM